MQLSLDKQYTKITRREINGLMKFKAEIPTVGWQTASEGKLVPPATVQ